VYVETPSYHVHNDFKSIQWHHLWHVWFITMQRMLMSCRYADSLSMGVKNMPFTADDMPYYRRAILFNLVNGKW
jgi:hypothetical protein